MSTIWRDTALHSVWLNVVCLCLVAYVLTAQVDFCHALWGRDQQTDQELLSGYVDIRGDLAAWGKRDGVHTSALDLLSDYSAY